MRIQKIVMALCVVPAAAMTFQAHAAPSRAARDQGVAERREEGRAPLASLVERLKRVRQEAGAQAGKAFPAEMGGMKTTNQTASLTGETVSHSLYHTFDDGDMLGYSSYDDGINNSVSAYEYGTDGDYSSLYASASEGDYKYHTIGRDMSRNANGEYSSRGMYMYDNSWTDSYSGQGYDYGSVGYYTYDYAPEGWSYESSSFAFKDWVNSTYAGGGTNSPDYSSYENWSSSRIESPNLPDYECSSTGSSSYNYTNGYQYTSDYGDDCYQLEGAGHYRHSMTHTDYNYDYSNWTYTYVYNGEISCDDANGVEQNYSFVYDMNTWMMVYTDLSTGEVVSGAACAWDPYSSMYY